MIDKKKTGVKYDHRPWQQGGKKDSDKENQTEDEGKGDLLKLAKSGPSLSPLERKQLIRWPQEQDVLLKSIAARTTHQANIQVPGRPSSAELKAMALRQQQQIDTQHQLLAAKEQRLRYLKAQEACGAAAAAEGERLRRLRERVEAQESKLRRLRALRGQVDLQKTYNVTLSNDLDSIRALFSEKEKELSLAVAKVDALTRQLEELRHDRRGPLNLIPGITSGNGTQPIASSQAALEFDKLRRELMYRNQLSLQQDARLHLQREALQQRQAELRSVDQRILELQNRLHKKKASNLILQTQQLHTQAHTNGSIFNSNSNNTSGNSNGNTNSNHNTNNINNNNNNIALQLLSTSSSTNKPSNSVYPSQRIIPRGNVAAVEPYIHTPQKTSHTPANLHHSQPKKLHHPIQDLTNLKLNLQSAVNNINVNHVTITDADDLSNLTRQKLHVKQSSKDSTETEIESADTKKTDSKYQTLPYSNSSRIGLSKSASSGAIPTYTPTVIPKNSESDNEKGVESDSTINSKSSGSQTHQQQQQHQQLTVHSTPLGTVNKSVAVAISTTNNSVKTTTGTNRLRKSIDKPILKPKTTKQHLPSGNLVVPPRKPISSVAPTSVTIAPKIVAHSPKVHVVAPNVNSTPIVSVCESDKLRPALPPKPAAKNADTEANAVSSVPTVVSVINKLHISEPSHQQLLDINHQSTQVNNNFPSSNPDKLPIKAKPLTIKKQPLSEQPRLRSLNVAVKPMQYSSRRIEMPPAFLFPEIEKANLKDKTESPNASSSIDDTDKSTSSSSTNGDELDIVKRSRVIGANENIKTKLARRVSFDPLALLLDASLEGELELVKKTTTQVPNPSAANDEGITALHNAICAGHFPIVKFLVEYGCDVNAQDSDGWTPLHCAASCNNLEMVKFLVENGACLFAATLSDHETPAEKCEEDEEGFDGCSEYLYSIQEKLGILNNGEVHAVFAYDSQQSDELSFDVNDRLIILRKGDDAEREWWWAKLPKTDQEGYVPRNLLGLYPRVPMQHSLDQCD